MKVFFHSNAKLANKHVSLILRTLKSACTGLITDIIMTLTYLITFKLTLWEPRSGTALTKIKAYDDSANCVQFYPLINDNTVPLLFSVGGHTCNVWHPFRKQSKQLLSYKMNETGEEVSTPTYMYKVIELKVTFCSETEHRAAPTI
jgi:hypothetical protein